MTQFRWQMDLADWFGQAVFIAAALHLLVYCPFFRWWETQTGRSLVLLSASLVGTLLGDVLMLWGAIRQVPSTAGTVNQGITSDIFSWISIISLGGAAVAVATLAIAAVRFTLEDPESRVTRWRTRIGTGRRGT